jgi:hypothetical protein
MRAIFAMIQRKSRIDSLNCVVSTISGATECHSDDIETQGSIDLGHHLPLRGTNVVAFSVTRKRCSDLHRFTSSMLRYRETRVCGISLLTKFNDIRTLANAFVAKLALLKLGSMSVATRNNRAPNDATAYSYAMRGVSPFKGRRTFFQ